MVIKETLRKYPPVPFLDRKCTNLNGYELKEYNYKIPHEMIIIIPTFAIHYDPNVSYLIHKCIQDYIYYNFYFRYIQIHIHLIPNVSHLKIFLQ